jgi:hypothetical protein
VRGIALATAGVAIAVLALCNGLLLWLYQHSSLAVVVTLGTFVAGVALTWLRSRSRQLTAIVIYVQALMAASILVGILIGLRAGIATGVLAGGITLAGLLLLSLVGLLYHTGERKPVAKVISLGTTVAIVVAMGVAYTFLSWGYQATTRRPTYVAPPGRSVDFLVEHGQYYTGDAAKDEPRVILRFENYTCPATREEVLLVFTELVHPGKQHLTTPEQVRTRSQATRGNMEIATVTATISVVDDLDGSVIAGPEAWTFHLEKSPSDQYWRVCSIERPT